MADFAVRKVSTEATRPLRQAVLRPHQSLAELAEHEPQDAHALGAFAGSELIAVGIIGRDGGPGAWRIRGMATAPHARGRGAGGAILAQLLAHAREHGAQRIWCNARIGARTLYERAGLRAVSGEIDLPEIGPHLVMEVVLADAPSTRRGEP